MPAPSDLGTQFLASAFCYKTHFNGQNANFLHKSTLCVLLNLAHIKWAFQLKAIIPKMLRPLPARRG